MKMQDEEKKKEGKRRARGKKYLFRAIELEKPR